MKWSILVTMLALSVFRLAGFFREPSLRREEIHAIAGEPHRRPAPQPRRPLTVVSWNIEQGVRYDDILSALRKLDADVVLLQEVDRFCARSGRRDVGHDLAHALEMNWISAGEFQEIGEGDANTPAITGQTVLSRYDILDPAVITFDEQANLRWRFSPIEPRRGGRMALRLQTAGITFYDLHLESGGSDRLRTVQLRQVVHDASPRTPGPIVVAGDFNNHVALQSFMFDDLVKNGFTDALGLIVDRQTSINHRHPIDWIFLRSLRARSGRVERVEGASDHYPVVATVATP